MDQSAVIMGRMRKEIYRMPHAEALAMLRVAPAVHVASVGQDGTPLLRTVHGVVVDGAVAFHGAPAGEKLEAIGRPAVVSAEEMVASIPSHFTDPERACPATTFYRSVQVHGVLERVEDPVQKAAVLTAVMERFLPEGGYVPIHPSHALYRKAVDGILVLRVPLLQVDGKAKLGQSRTPAELGVIVEKLWQRGGPGDLRAMELVRGANPDLMLPAFLRGPAGVTLHVHLDDAALAGVLPLVRDTYWNQQLPEGLLRASHLGATAWVGARTADGELVGSTRAVSDGAKFAYVFDVVVAASWRGRGIGQALMRLLLDHPRLRQVRRIGLRTRDARTLYARFGFADARSEPGLPGHVEMVRLHTGPVPRCGAG